MLMSILGKLVKDAMVDQANRRRISSIKYEINRKETREAQRSNGIGLFWTLLNFYFSLRSSINQYLLLFG